MKNKLLVEFKACVDAGNISVVDLGYIEHNGGKVGKTANKFCSTIDLKKGDYLVNIKMETLNGNVDVTRKLQALSGKVGIGDMCYFFASNEAEYNKWFDFLSKTDYLSERIENLESIVPFITVDTGGDGNFSVKVSFTLL